MGQIKWYKRDPSAALNGMMELSLEERGAYNTVLDLIYSRDGNLTDDDRFIAGWLRVDVRVWKRIKSTLIERGKLYILDGCLRNERADVEVLAALSRVASASDAGRASALSKASKSKRKSSKNNSKTSTTVETTASTPVSTNHNHNQKEEYSNEYPSPREWPISPFPKPDWADAQVWADFLKNRKTKRLPNTVTAYKGFLDDIARLTTDQWTPERLLAHAVKKGWGAIYEPRELNTNDRTPAPARFEPNRATSDIGRDVAARLEQQADGFGSSRAPVSLPRPRPSGWPD